MGWLTDPNTIILASTVAIIVMLIIAIKIPPGQLRTKIFDLIKKLIDKISTKK